VPPGQAAAGVPLPGGGGGGGGAGVPGTGTTIVPSPGEATPPGPQAASETTVVSNRIERRRSIWNPLSAEGSPPLAASPFVNPSSEVL
jgi:hypothetical protein